MDIQVGDRITYRYLEIKDKIFIAIINVLSELIDYERMVKENQIEILKIERPKYEVIEEKKELLTEEEREFLKQVLIFMDKKISSINITQILNNKKEIHFNQKEDGSGLGYWYYVKNSFFNGLEIDKVYTLKELGLEGK